MTEDRGTDGRKIARELFGLFLIFWGLLVLLSLLSFDQSDPGINHAVSRAAAVKNSAGLFGAYISGLLVDIFGFASLVWPAVFIAWGAGCVSTWFTMPWWRWFGFLLLAACLISLGAAWNLGIGDVRGGGMLGMSLYRKGTAMFNPVGSILIWLFLLFISLELAFGIAWLSLLKSGWNVLKAKLGERHFSWAGLAAALPRVSMPKLALPHRDRAPQAGHAPLDIIPLYDIHVDDALPGQLPRLDGIGMSGVSDGRGGPEAGSEGAADGETLTAAADPPARIAADMPGADASAGAQAVPAFTPLPMGPSGSDAGEDGQGLSLSRMEGPARADAALRAPIREASAVAPSAAAPPAARVSSLRSASPDPDIPAARAVPPAPPAREASIPPVQTAAAESRAEKEPACVAPLRDAPAASAPPWEAAPAPLPIRTSGPAEAPAPGTMPAPRRRPLPMPSLDLLQAPQKSDALPSREVLEQKSRELMNCLGDFNIQGDLIRVTPGPVITLFEIRPAPGVRVGRITNLNDDLARSLRAEAVRIQAPVPGCDTVGIEIPNAARATVNFRELVQSTSFRDSDSRLTMALGKDIEGRPAVRDLATMPHALVAGTTGSGKSVCLNSILVSFLYKATPDEVKLMLVDPKRVEMSMYADLPHLVHPVVTEMTLAKTALDWAVHEMERRYDCLARLGVKNIKDFNKKILAMGENRPATLADLAYLPYLVIVIDELADLMMTAGKEVEACLVRLAQLARAAGIHLIVATQRPSVDVVTGILRANFPCRIAFQVANKYDSRTILDASGAEKLLGKGDMLFKPSGGKLQRLHGPFVTDEEVEAVVEHWKRQRPPQYDVDFSEWGTAATEARGSAGAASAGAAGSSEEEALYAEAIAFVQEQGRMSISLLQRRFRIGFNKAARFVERMEQDGILPPASRANKARSVRPENQ